MNKGKPSTAFERVYLSHYWGNKLNSGKNYKRSYNKTKHSKGL